jgi:putative membrane protein
MTADVKARGNRAVIGLVITAVLLGGLLWWHPPGLYLWAKAVHIIAVISWMAGMLYLPRLFIYHCEAEPGSRQSETFKVMEWRLLTIIINPAMVATWVLGVWLAHDGGWLTAGWLHAKFALVVALSGVHGFMVRCVRDFGADQNRHTQKFYRIFNEIPSGGAQTVLTQIQIVDSAHAGLAQRTLFPYVRIISPTAGRCFRIRPARIGTGRCIGPLARKLASIPSPSTFAPTG